MTEDQATGLRNARRYILSWQFLTFTTAMIVFWITMSMAIGTPTNLVRTDILQMIFVSIVSGAAVLGLLLFIMLTNFQNDKHAWMFPFVLASTTIVGMSAVIYRHQDTLITLTDKQLFMHSAYSVLIILGMTAFVKIVLRFILGKNYTA